MDVWLGSIEMRAIEIRNDQRIFLLLNTVFKHGKTLGPAKLPRGISDVTVRSL